MSTSTTNIRPEASVLFVPSGDAEESSLRPSDAGESAAPIKTPVATTASKPLDTGETRTYGDSEVEGHYQRFMRDTRESGDGLEKKYWDQKERREKREKRKKSKDSEGPTSTEQA